MKSIELLKSDHAKLNDLFDQAEATDDSREKRRLFHEIFQLLDRHLYVEETVFYAHLTEREGFAERIQNSYDEHQKVRDLLKQASKEKVQVEFDRILDELISCFQHHVEDEEEGLFPKVEEALSSPDDRAELDDHIIRARETWSNGRDGPGREAA